LGYDDVDFSVPGVSIVVVEIGVVLSVVVVVVAVAESEQPEGEPHDIPVHIEWSQSLQQQWQLDPQ